MSGRTYHLVARDGSGVFLGLDLVQCLLLGAGLVVAVGLRLGGISVLVSAVPLLAAGAVSKVPVAGSPLCRWLPVVSSVVMGRLAGRWRWRGALPLLPYEATDEVDMPPVLEGLDVVELGEGHERIAVVRDERNARLTAVLPVGGEEFAGAAGEHQDALLAGWGEVLAQHAGSDAGVVQVGWSQHIRPSNLDAHRRWVSGLAEPGDQDEPACMAYGELVDEVEQQAATHDTVVWATVAGAEISGRGRLLDRAAAQLPVAVDGLVRGLRDASLTVGPPLAAHALWRLLRLRCDPTPTARTGSALSLAQRTGVLGPANGRPLAMETSWDSVRIDGAVHRSYWVEAWPRRPVSAGWLQGFLVSGESMAMTVIHRPVDPRRSHRRIDSQLVKLGAHRARKEERSRRVTETDRRTEQSVHDLEAELASGYAETVYLGLVTVTAPSADELDDRCHRTEHAARSAQLGLRVLHGRQDVAWAASLPLGLTEPGLLELVGL